MLEMRTVICHNERLLQTTQLKLLSITKEVGCVKRHKWVSCHLTPNISVTFHQELIFDRGHNKKLLLNMND